MAGRTSLVRKVIGSVADLASSSRRATLNIGLDIPGGGRLAEEEVLSVLQRIGAKPVRVVRHQSDTEPTLVIELDRSLAPEQAHEVSRMLQQEAIAQVDEAGRGDLFGPGADKWKPFNGDYFIEGDGRRLTQAIMEAGSPDNVPGGAAADPVMERLDEIAASLKKDEPAYNKGGLVKDGAKALMRLYHGRSYREPIQRLDPTISPDQLGIHLGDPETASKFATIRPNVGPRDAGARVIPLDVDLQNPLRLMDRHGKWRPDDVYEQLVEQGLVEYDDVTAIRLERASQGMVQDEAGDWVDMGDEMAQLDAMLEVQDMIRDLGYDGVVYLNRYEMPSEALERARTRDAIELKTMGDDDFRRDFPEAVDSYIAFRNEQLKSPFGDGPGVGFSEGGRVGLEGGGRAGLAYKVGKGLVDFLDFSGVANKPKTVKIPERGEFPALPIKELDEAAESYMRKHGIPGTHRIDGYPEFDEEFARRIAGAFEDAKHMPNDPAVRRTYDALIDETMEQYKALKDTGLDIRFWRDADPYAKSPSMGYADIIDNGQLWVFPSDYGFGTSAAFDPSNNPLLKRVGRVGDKDDAVANDAFRAVHDAYGHFGPGNPFFRMAGEDRAWQHHGRMYSDEAIPAMTAETRGQNSWVNYGPHEEFNRGRSGADTIYADQKATILPSWVWERDLGRTPKFADGGRVPMNRAGFVKKAAESVFDYLSGSDADKLIRDDVINATELRGDGRKFATFFDDVTGGKSGKYIPQGLDNYNPAITLGDDEALFRLMRDYYSGNFDNHIKTSIPGFDEVQNAVGSSLLKTYGRDGADMLDIASSEGALIKALSEGSEGRIRTTGIEPNPGMVRTYMSKPQAPNSRVDMSAFGGADDAGKVAWVEDDGTVIPFFDPKGQLYDVGHEAMAFQFISNARKPQIERVKQMLKPKGIAIFEEKFGGPKAIFDANEAKKDLYKAQYYTPEQMEIKRKEVLNTGNDAAEGMTDLQVSNAEMEAILRDAFKNRAQFWDSGNFKGYVASDDNKALEDFLNNLQSLDSDYATTKTPRGFADGGPVWSEEDRRSMTHDKSYGSGREMNYLETLGQKVPLGEMNYFDVDGERQKPEGVQALHDMARMGIYGVPVVGPWIGAGLDTTEALATDDPLTAGMAVAFGPGGKKAKAALTGGLAYAMDPAEAEAGMFGLLSKWGLSSEGKDAVHYAARLTRDGADPEEVRRATSWFKDLDGKWKFELPSAGGWADIARPGKGRLADYYDDPYLFEQYPHLKDMEVTRRRGSGASYDPMNQRIMIGDLSDPFFSKPEIGGLKGVFDHEIYHRKAGLEGWAQGSNVDTARQEIANDIKRFLAMKGNPYVQQVGKNLESWTPEQRDALAFSRYEADIGEALASREAKRRDLTGSKIRYSNPTTDIAMPPGAVFYKGQPGTIDQYSALVDWHNSKAKK